MLQYKAAVAGAAREGPAWSDSQIAEALDVRVAAIHRSRRVYVELGLEAALERKRRTDPQYRKLDGVQEAKRVTGVEKCGSENNVAARPFPAVLSGAKDPSLIPEFIALGNSVITLDGSFLDDNAACIPDAHPGFVFVRFSYKVVNRQLPSSATARILRDFKSRVANWFQGSIRDSIVIVTVGKMIPRAGG